MNRISVEGQLERLGKLDTCCVSDALDQLGIKGAALGIRTLSVPRRIHGVASTVRLAPAGDDIPQRHLCTAAVEAADERTIIVVAHGGRTDVAGWGGVLSTAAAERGVRGVVIDGACRDVDESRELGMPVFGRGVVPLTARSRVVEKDWNVPVEIGGVPVAPGDLVIADGSGVVFVAQDKAPQVITLAERISEKERLMVSALRAGEPVSRVMGADYERMLKGASDG